jgi:hypothetical protein
VWDAASAYAISNVEKFQKMEKNTIEFGTSVLELYVERMFALSARHIGHNVLKL